MPADSIVSVERTLRERITLPLPGADAHRRFAPVPWLDNWAPDLTPDDARRAAAMILVFPNDDGLSIPLTVRHRDLARHAGQVSLPGGALDVGESAEAAALREVEEEIGVGADDIRVIGPLSTVWIAVSNFVVHPFVAVTDARPTFRLHPGEVSTLIHAPLATIQDPAKLRWESRERLGLRVRYPYFEVDGHVVWGATAMMLGEFACLFDAGHRPPPEE